MAIRGDYLQSPISILHIVQCVLCMLAFICCASTEWNARGNKAAYTYFNFVTMSAFWVTLIFFCVFLLGVSDAMPQIKWRFLDLIAQGVCLFFIIIAAPLEAARVDSIAGHKAAAVFGFFAMAAYFVGAFSAFMNWRNAGDMAPPAASGIVEHGNNKSAPQYNAGSFGTY
ncbi:PREDICTED: CKLF-like MARVEL transmembrane domain-containing protein 4 [Priapulus caudatus]|uniref:CKLF-like MARVEL transmembrane domain-containing protein 4 n=1 Tax=Priapulus caudatus TaxID=37621 RepID=A0ABM1EV47_PRICU|nr:PREDICTED: CKLF-like MARVEL transmembrane domain-containing protein 4 [Priapulus caudatus]